MKKIVSLFFASLLCGTFSFANEKNFYVEYKDITYKTVDNKDIKLNLFIPNIKTNKKIPLLVWVHGGAWMRGSKDSFMKEKNILLGQTLLKKGYAIASVDYRLSHEAIFPAQIQDINDAINFLYESAGKYNISVDKIVLMGRSAGGHLSALLGTTNSHKNINFFEKGKEPKYKVEANVDFFGPSDIDKLRGNSGRVDHDADNSAESKLLGVNPRKRPDLAKWISPTTYINEDTKPFIILHGDNDKTVPATQSYTLKRYLDKYSIPNEIYIVKGARHGDPVFDSEKYVSKVVSFLNKYFPTK